MDFPFYLRLAGAIPVYGLAVFYLYKAGKKGRFLFLSLLVAILYGLALELFDIRETHAYYYERLLIMIGEFPDWAPLTVAASWGILLWITMSTTERLGLPWYQGALADGLLAVSLDFFMDPVYSSNRVIERAGQICADGNFPHGDSVGLGVWVWCIQPTETELWFGVPIPNFVGWFVVLAAFSAGVRFVRLKLKADEKGLTVQLLLLAAVVVFSMLLTFVLSRGFASITQGQSFGWWILAAICAVPLFFLFRAAHRRRISGKMDPWLLVFPLLTFASCFLTCFATPIYKESPILPVVVLLCGLFTIGLFSWQALAPRIFPPPRPGASA